MDVQGMSVREGSPNCKSLFGGKSKRGVENHQTLVISKRPSPIRRMFSTPRPHTYIQEDKVTRVLDLEGLASMYLGIQDLVTNLNLSYGLA